MNTDQLLAKPDCSLIKQE
jgi:hypothetical protein